MHISEPWRSILVALLTAALTLLGGTAVTQVGGCWRGPHIPPPDIDTPPPDARPDAIQAIGKLVLRSAYCSGTVVGPRRSDGRWLIVSAAHCASRVGEDAVFVQRDGISRKVTCIALDRRPDVSVWSTDTGQGAMPYALIADRTPAAGTDIWHAGYGRDKPGNVERGKVLDGPNNSGQVHYHLSVSPGDSGGGIMIDSSGYLLSPVCCTTRLDGPGEVWGGSPESVRRMIATPTDYIDLPPVEMPPPPTKPMP